MFVNFQTLFLELVTELHLTVEDISGFFIFYLLQIPIVTIQKLVLLWEENGLT